MVLAVADEHPMDGVDGELQLVEPDELDAQPLDAELPFPAQLEDQLLLALEHFALWRWKRSPAPILKAGLALGLVAPPPLAECRSRDPAAATDHPCIADLRIQLHPAEPRPGIHPAPPHRRHNHSASLVALRGNPTDHDGAQRGETISSNFTVRPTGAHRPRRISLTPARSCRGTGP